MRINNQYGLDSYKAFKEHFEKLGGKIPIVDSFEIEQKDFRSTIAKISAGNPEGIYITGFGYGYGAAIKQIQEMKIQSLILSDNVLAAPYFQKIAGGAEGAYYIGTLFDPSSDNDKIKKFVKTYEEKYKSSPTHLTAFAYDALYLIAEAIKIGGYSKEGIRKGLLSIKEHEGLAGHMSFTTHGELKAPLVVRRIKQGKSEIVSSYYNW